MNNILEQMLEVESEAQQLVEDAKAEANGIRTKAREDAEQLMREGKQQIEERIQRETERLEQDAHTQKEVILNEMDAQLADMEPVANERIECAVERVVAKILPREGG
ncbi:hypothetical protein GF339_11910 [candidate division KSB3 bacterium]|uniref:V-type ATP synthase subunit H n=1 Tax=candidate division KSB3 bacterium TaxID=2044937 RepID=A0A9D5JVY5_9BACT|nr:hypothetical protein [candidate division KSB3 bacterium]MBD3325284.1 hypothetical protein [candidate division KSB3 bacterium]